MNSIGSKIRFFICCVCCIVVIFYGIYTVLFFETAAKPTVAQKDTNDILDFSNFPFLNSFKGEIQENTPIKNEVTSVDIDFQKAVEAASNGKVQGKVIDRFISPYTAKDSYGNVYIKNSTPLKLDIKSLLEAKLKFSIKKNSTPQVLILHTHATESFLLSERNYYTDKDTARSTDNSLNMVHLGKIVTDTLKKAGISTLHDTTQHDYPSYSESYSRAAKTISNYKSKYKDLKIIIDLHRDALSSGDTDKVKLTSEISGKKAAQVMIVMGSQSGDVKNFPNWQENLKLAVKLQQKLELMYPTLARSLSLTSKNYNESLSTGSMLIEIGTDANSIEEVRYSTELLANALVSLFNDLQ